MKILLVADAESPSLWDYYKPGKLSGYDLIISAGDLKPEYLSFLVTLANCPLLYVHGNHDEQYEKNPPEGCYSIDGKVVKIKGLRILGLGGVKKYKDGPHQYTETEMKRRIMKVKWELFKHRGVDIVVTHTPPLGYGDDTDLAHQGFEAFLPLLDKYHPKYLIHGHIHKNYKSINFKREINYKDTKIINACEKYDLEI